MTVLTEWTEVAASDPAAARSHLRDLVRSPLVREAIAIASPSLDRDIDTWLAEPASDRGQRIERSLVRYVSRMAGRPTPFGLLATVSTAEVAADTDLVVAPAAACRRRMTVDAELLAELGGRVLADGHLRRQLRFRRNPTLRRCGDRMRYSQWVRLPGRAGALARRRYRTVDVPWDARVHAIAAFASDDISLAELVDTIADNRPEDDRAALAALVDRMAAAQILVARLGTVLTGAEPIDAFGDELARCQPDHPLLAMIHSVRSRLAAADEAPVGEALDQVRSITGDVMGLVAGPVRAIHGELFRPAGSARVSRAVVDSIGQGAALLWRLNPGPSHASRALASFRHRFAERYGLAEVPLLQAIDPDCAEEFYSSTDRDPGPRLLAGLEPPASRAQPGTWSAREAHLLRRLGQSDGELVLSDDDVEGLAAGDRPMPEAFAVMATVLPAGEVLIEGGSGPSGARSLGRFCHGDESLASLVGDHIAAEQALAPEHIFAEIVHLPAEPVASVQCRPKLRGAEIVVSGASAATGSERIEPGEITVRVRGDRVLLRCPRLDRDIAPRQSTAHGPRLGDPLYRFLLAIQDQDGGSFAWSWGSLSDAPFLPRVRRGSWILARARWRLFGDELADLDAEAMQVLRTRRGLPGLVTWIDGDSELPIDLDNPLSVASLVQLIRGRDHAVLGELLPGPAELCAHGPAGRYQHQLVVTFTAAAPKRERSRPRVGQAPVVHRLGSSWLSIHLYGRSQRSDQVLTELVAPLRRHALGAGVCDRWFFVRYHDGIGPHVRLRLHGSAADLMGDVLPRAAELAAPLLAGGALEQLSIGEYWPELGRYGGPGAMATIEAAMSHDSDAVLDLLALSDDQRWLAAAAGIDGLWRDLGWDVPARMAAARNCYAALTDEQGQAREVADLVRRRYQHSRAVLARCLGDSACAEPGPARVRAIMERRSHRLRPIVASLFELEGKGSLTRPVADIAGCLAHMHVNRMLASAQRVQERVLYGLLSRYHGETLGRARRSSTAHQPKEAA